MLQDRPAVGLKRSLIRPLLFAGRDHFSEGRHYNIALGRCTDDGSVWVFPVQPTSQVLVLYLRNDFYCNGWLCSGGSKPCISDLRACILFDLNCRSLGIVEASRLVFWISDGAAAHDPLRLRVVHRPVLLRSGETAVSSIVAHLPVRVEVTAVLNLFAMRQAIAVEVHLGSEGATIADLLLGRVSF